MKLVVHQLLELIQYQHLHVLLHAKDLKHLHPHQLLANGQGRRDENRDMPEVVQYWKVLEKVRSLVWQAGEELQHLDLI